MESPLKTVGAYASHQRAEEDARTTEAHALLRCASRLEMVRQEGVDSNEYVAAIRHNQQLWTILQVGLCEPDNALPRDLKTTLLNLSLYVDKTSFEAMSGHAPDKLKSLIEINLNIAAGLTTLAESSAPASSSAPPSAEQPSSVTRMA